MPTYKVKPENNSGMNIATDSQAKKKKTYPTVTIPVSPEIIAALEVGKPVTVELQGTVCALESRQSTDNYPYSNRNELRIELRVVDAEAGEETDDEPEEKEPDMKDAIDKGLGYSKK